LVAVQAPFSNFGLAARQSNVSPDLLGVGVLASLSACHLLRFFHSENRNYTVNVCSSDTNNNTNKLGDWT